MMTEKPLVTWKVIADYMSVCVNTAIKRLRKCHKIKIGRLVAVYPSDLERFLKKRG